MPVQDPVLPENHHPHKALQTEFHLHLIPRYKGDQVGLGWKMGELSEEDKKEILDKMK